MNKTEKYISYIKLHGIKDIDLSINQYKKNKINFQELEYIAMNSNFYLMRVCIKSLKLKRILKK